MKRAQAKSVTREKLLSTAKAIFVKSDFKASTFEVAKAAGIAHGTFFFHFRRRDDIILAVVRNLVIEITDVLYHAYTSSNSLKEFLLAHFDAVRVNWFLVRSLLVGFAKFDDKTRQEVMTLLAVINYYLAEAFNKWADNGSTRTILWQGALVYLSFFGDYMYDKRRISEKFMENVISFLGGSFNGVKKKSEHRTLSDEKKRHCISCGMIFRSSDDYPMSDKSKEYCRFCARKDGTLGSFKEVFHTMTIFFQSALGLNSKAARHSALTVLAKNPAWKDYLSSGQKRRLP